MTKTRRVREKKYPVWTWNAPGFLTQDRFGTRLELRSRHTDQTHKEVGAQDKGKLTIKEKVQNVRDYFGSLEEYERRKGGRTHYRIILSFDVPATNQQIRDLTNRFLEDAFPKAITFATIHRDTDHPHVHLYLNSRQYDGRRIQLKNNEVSVGSSVVAGIREIRPNARTPTSRLKQFAGYRR